MERVVENDTIYLISPVILWELALSGDSQYLKENPKSVVKIELTLPDAPEGEEMK